MKMPIPTFGRERVTFPLAIRCAPHFRCIALQILELWHRATEKQLVAHAQDLSSFGCLVETAQPFAEGTKVRVRITRNRFSIR